MDEMITKRNDLLAERVIKGLESRNMTGYYAADKEEALKLALEIIPEGASVTMGGAMSAREIGLVDALKDANVRVEFDDRSEKFGYKMREAQIAKVPYIVVLGKNEEAQRQISYRLHGEQGTTTVDFDDFVSIVTSEIAEKR